MVRPNSPTGVKRQMWKRTDVLDSLRKEVRQFADYVLDRCNNRGMFSKPIIEICVDYAQLHGKRKNNVVRYLPVLVSSGFLMHDMSSLTHLFIERFVDDGKSSYEVYAAVSEDGEYLYIGAGKRGRHLHCTSGISNCYDLNRLHFSVVKVRVIVLKLFEDKQTAFDYEKQMIAELKPLFNKRAW